MVVKLDKYWIYTKGMQCPQCKKIGLWNDTHPNAEANYYCKKCDDGFTIVDSVPLR